MDISVKEQLLKEIEKTSDSTLKNDNHRTLIENNDFKLEDLVKTVTPNRTEYLL